MGLYVCLCTGALCSIHNIYNTIQYSTGTGSFRYGTILIVALLGSASYRARIRFIIIEF